MMRISLTAAAAALFTLFLGAFAAQADAPTAGFERPKPTIVPDGGGPWTAYDCCGRAWYPYQGHKRHHHYHGHYPQTWSRVQPAPRYAARIYRDGQLYSPYRPFRPVIELRGHRKLGHRRYIVNRPLATAYPEIQGGRVASADWVGVDYPYDDRCQHWSYRCSEAWGNEADYQGCLRYHSC